MGGMGQVGIPRSGIREGHREAVGEALRQALGGVVSAAMERSDAGDRLTKAAQLLKHGLYGTLRQVRAEAEENDVGNHRGDNAAPPSCRSPPPEEWDESKAEGAIEHWPKESNRFDSLLTDFYLLTKVKELGDVSTSDLVRACGYARSKKVGDERLRFATMFGMKSGDEVEIKLGGKRVRLVPVVGGGKR
jgi:hypothetical protein